MSQKNSCTVTATPEVEDVYEECYSKLEALHSNLNALIFKDLSDGKWDMDEGYLNTIKKSKDAAEYMHGVREVIKLLKKRHDCRHAIGNKRN
jgi:inhibitor of KinA sporulation pathway (predicted exonuclease)